MRGGRGAAVGSGPSSRGGPAARCVHLDPHNFHSVMQISFQAVREGFEQFVWDAIWSSRFIAG